MQQTVKRSIEDDGQTLHIVDRMNGPKVKKTIVTHLFFSSTKQA